MPLLPDTARRPGVVLALAALAALAGCGDDRAPGTTGPSVPSVRSAFSTAVSSTGTALVFLPPLGPTVPSYTGTFDGAKSPVVEICRWTGNACSGAPVARFTLASGTGGTPLRVVTDQQHYRADWKANDRTAGAVYRVRVLLGGAELGGASTRVLRPGETEAQVLAAGFVPVSRSQNFIIRFRLETGTRFLPGAPGDAAASAIPLRDFVPRAADYSPGHPALPSALLSHNTLVVVPRPGVTVGELNALLAEIGAEIVGGMPGATGASGLLALRLPTSTHAAMQSTLERLRADARVAGAAQDARVGDDVVAAAPLDLPWVWEWKLAPGDANWGLEAVRAPQLWNLNAGVRRSLEAAGVLGPLVGVLDAGFASGHPDLAYAANRTPALTSRHGTMVAGIIGATFDNMKGVDGVNPFARLVVGGVHVDSAGATFASRRSTSSMMLLWDLYRMVRDHPTIRVVNVSQGYNWYRASPPISMADTTVQRIATAHGAAAVEMLRALESANGELPVIVVSAGNASGGQLGLQTARYSSPLANAAIAHGAAPVVVVEASGGDGAGGLTRAAFSNIGGHVSAPGVQVASTDSVPGRYHYDDGTSFAAPHVAGVASYLYAIHPTLARPTLTSNPVRDVLVATGTPAGGLPPHLDAFAAALRLDLVVGGDHVLRTLVDVDDGTLDGNTRTNADGSDYTADARGDGRVDMRDFRRWRDWYLAATKRPGVQLDGTPRHWKKDVNGNGAWAADGDDENVYPRGDFNGDGVLSATATRSVAGVMGGAASTDLAVLQRLFDDGPDGYAKDDLPALLESADVTVAASACLSQPGVASVRVAVYRAADPVPLTGGRAHDAARPVRVHTVSVAGGGTAVTVQAEALDLSDRVLARDEEDLTLAAGGDVRWEPTCLLVTPPSAEVPSEGTQQFGARMPGALPAAVSWTAVRGAITPAGLYTAPAAPGAVDTIVATSATRPGARAYAVVTVGMGDGGGHVEPLYHSVGVTASATFDGTFPGGGPAPTRAEKSDDTCCSGGVRNVEMTDVATTLAGGYTVPGDDYAPAGWSWNASGSASGSFRTTYTKSASGALLVVTGGGRLASQASRSMSGTPTFSTSLSTLSVARQSLSFRVVGGPVTFTLTYSCEVGDHGSAASMTQADLVLRGGGLSQDPALFYCNAWGKPSVSETVTGVLPPGEYSLSVRGQAASVASTGPYDLTTPMLSTSEYRLTFQR